MVLRKDHDQSNRCCRESLAQRVGTTVWLSLDQSPARIEPALLLGHLPSRLDFAAGFLRVHLNAVRQARYRMALRARSAAARRTRPCGIAREILRDEPEPEVYRKLRALVTPAAHNGQKRT